MRTQTYISLRYLKAQLLKNLLILHLIINDLLLLVKVGTLFGAGDTKVNKLTYSVHSLTGLLMGRKAKEKAGT